MGCRGLRVREVGHSSGLTKVFRANLIASVDPGRGSHREIHCLREERLKQPQVSV